VLRPLLSVRADRIRAWLAARAVGWVDDPSNRDPRFLRARMRAAACAPAPSPPRWPDRAALERALASWLGVHAEIHPEGWVALAREHFLRLPPGMAALALRAAVMTVGGAVHPPRQQALDAAAAWCAATGEGTRDFGGCRLGRRGSRIVVLRVSARGPITGVPAARGETLWDGRFLVRLAPLDRDGAEILPAGYLCPSLAHAVEDTVLRSVARALPAPRALDGVTDLSHLLCGRRSVALVTVTGVSVIFRPPRTLAGAAFAGSPVQV
jgi:tRNA(Ile)-lysidine synthase